MSISFDNLYKILKKTTTEELPEEVVEVCRLTPEAYTAILLALPAADQFELRDHYAIAEKNITLLTQVISKVKKKELVDVAIDHLLCIRDYQNFMRLVNDLDPSVERDFLQMTYYSVSKNQRRDIVNKVLSVIDELPHASQRDAAVHLLKRIQNPENRLNALLGAVHIAKFCRTPDDVIGLGKLCTIVNVEIGPSLDALKGVVSKISADNWYRFYKAIKVDGLITFTNLATLLMPIGRITFDECISLLDVVRRYIDEPQRCLDAIPLLTLCEEGSHSAQIVEIVAQMPQMQRRGIVQRVADSFVSSTDSSIVHMVLDQQRDIAAQVMFVQALMGGIQRMQVEDSFVIDSDELEKIPLVVLRNFIEFIKADDRVPETLGFLGNDTRGPGIAKEFLSQLVAVVCKKLGVTVLDDGRMRLNKHKDNLSHEEIQAFNDLGKLFMFCMQKELVIGMQLDPGLFYALTHVCENHYLCEITEDTIDQFFPLYSQMMSFYENDTSSIKAMRDTLHEQETVEVVVEAMSKTITPCIEIWVGMKIPEGMSALELERQIQGSVTAEDIIKQLQYGTGITDDNRPQIEAWVRNLDANPKKLLRFLTVVTGAPGLGPKPIVLEISGISIQAHTCVQQLSLPSDNTIEEVLQELDKAMENENYFNSK